MLRFWKFHVKKSIGDFRHVGGANFCMYSVASIWVETTILRFIGMMLIANAMVLFWRMGLPTGIENNRCHVRFI
jgi:hypothetical protein